MITDAHEQLIQDVIAGEASPARAAELEHLIASNPEARFRYDEMRELFRVMADAPVPQPPADLHAGIMRAIAAEPSHAIVTRVRRSRLSLVATFLTGAAAASLVIVAMLRGPVAGLPGPDLATSGTMAPLEASKGAATSRASLATGVGWIELSSSRMGDVVRLDIHSPAGSPAGLEVTFASEDLALTGMRWAQHPEGPITATAGRVTLAGRVAGDVTLTFHATTAGDAPIRVSAEGSQSVLLHTSPQQR